MATARVDLYNTSYSKYDQQPYPQIRMETYGEDFGQTSWVTNAESAEIPRLLGINGASTVLEAGCGSGRYALHVAEQTGCTMLGVDLHADGVRNARRLTEAQGLRVRFDTCDLAQPLPFADGNFDAIYANDVMCHIRGRAEVLREYRRVTKPGGRLLFSDALVIGGLVSHEEIATRTAIGYFLLSPVGENERLLAAAGWKVIEARDTTASSTEISGRWHAARAKRQAELVALEGEENFRGLQRFLSCVRQLTGERRLLRYLYVAEKALTGAD
jgi:SAM-dependent methyltransferase